MRPETGPTCLARCADQSCSPRCCLLSLTVSSLSCLVLCLTLLRPAQKYSSLNNCPLSNPGTQEQERKYTSTPDPRCSRLCSLRFSLIYCAPGLVHCSRLCPSYPSSPPANRSSPPTFFSVPLILSFDRLPSLFLFCVDHQPLSRSDQNTTTIPSLTTFLSSIFLSSFLWVYQCLSIILLASSSSSRLISLVITLSLVELAPHVEPHITPRSTSPSPSPPSPPSPAQSPFTSTPPQHCDPCLTAATVTNIIHLAFTQPQVHCPRPHALSFLLLVAPAGF